MAKFGIALALGARDFAGSNPVIPTIQSVLIVTEKFCKNTLLFYFHILISNFVDEITFNIIHPKIAVAGAAVGTYVTSTPFLVSIVISGSGIGISSGILIAPIQL